LRGGAFDNISEQERVASNGLDSFYRTFVRLR